MQTKNNIIKVILGWLIKFFVPPMVGALILSVLNEIAFFYENYDFVVMLADPPIKVFIYSIVRSFTTLFYGYYLLVYIPFFIYLVLLQKFNKLSLVVVMASGFIYGLSPLLFGAVNSLDDLFLNLDNLLMLLAIASIASSGAICAATYYVLHKKLTRSV